MSAEKLITDHIDIWTSAVQAKSSSGRGSGKKREIYGIKKLRELILELAVRGKLVPQDPNDEPASVLLERIASEKTELVKQKQLKKLKPLPAITDEEKPFALPLGWEWVQVGNVCTFVNGFAFKSSSFQEIGVGVVKIGDISSSGQITNASMSRVSPQVVAGLDPMLKVATGDLVIAMSGATTGKLGFNVDDETYYLNQRVGKFWSHGVRLEFMYLPLTTKVAENLSKSMGSAIPNISTGQINEIVFALPPLAEQHRIVAKVDELMALCDQLEQQTEASLDAHQVLVETLLATLTNSQDATELMVNWARISEHFDTLFTAEQSIDQLKQTILQLAVMGKLVPQDPNDEPAAKLLERIAEEKAQLVKEKKIKKQKALPPIAEDEKPFELPNGWVWARIFDASLFSEYGSSEKTVTELPDGVPVLKMGDIQAGKVILGEHQVVSAQIEDLPNLYLKFGDVLYNRTNSAELVGKTGMFKGEDDVYTFASYLIRIRCSFNNVMPEYLSLSMNTPLFRKTQIEPHIKQQCGQANVNGTLMKHMLVSVPPVREQARLMAKTKELLSFCDQLKQRLRDSQQTQLQLTDAIVEQAL
ncbi:TPA: restriction endonuclease subunit S [Vibrio cholerae]|uniref:restriction endonuclease subunit S n=1 Tax=Vibrio cholerae TaxID=666 RepID=UPI001157CB61|nr:restriction endonuclease subunit S [Vibrio cholerae]TQO96901.1 restriction endonuclease subunit S [Vibrio cholerae]HDZ9391183.1 restriction endonuclease subunit S [Vibrio cholerae]